MAGKSRRHDGHAIDPVKLQEWMSRRVLSQEKLGARLGVSSRVIRFYLSGKRRPRDENFRKLYIALGCGPEDLLRGRPKREHVMDKNTYRKSVVASSSLSPEQALSTLEKMIKAAGWKGVLTSAAEECLEVLRSNLEP